MFLDNDIWHWILSVSSFYAPRSTLFFFLLSLSLPLLLYLCLLCSPSSSLSYVSIFVFLPSIVFLPLDRLSPPRSSFSPSGHLCRSFFPLVFDPYRRLLILFSSLSMSLHTLSLSISLLFPFFLISSPSSVFQKTSILFLSLSVSPILIFLSCVSKFLLYVSLCALEPGTFLIYVTEELSEYICTYFLIFSLKRTFWPKSCMLTHCMTWRKPVSGRRFCLLFFPGFIFRGLPDIPEFGPWLHNSLQENKTIHESSIFEIRE